MKGILTCGFFFLFFYISAQNVAIQEVLYDQPLGLDKFELVNTTAGTIDVTGWWTCAKFNYRNLGSVTDFEILQGSLNMAPGSHLKMRFITYDLNNTQGDFCIYTDGNFGAATSMEDFIQYGSSMDEGRGYLAVQKGIWRDMDPGTPLVLDFIPTVTTPGNSTNFDGTNGGGGELTFSTDFTNGPATLPISLLTLSGRINVNKQVELNWIALDEYNVYKHVVEKSTDGESYDAIGEMIAQNLGATPGYYTFLDASPALNILNYYRIRQVDFDYKEVISSTLYVKVKEVDNHKMFISPMPVVNNACFSMEFYWPNEEPLAQFKVVDMAGRLITSFDEPVMEGYNNVMHQFHGVVPAEYVMILSGNNPDYVAQSFMVGK